MEPMTVAPSRFARHRAGRLIYTRRMRRRDVLKSAGALAGAAVASKVLPACGTGAKAGRIDTLVYLMMENRTYDHVLGARTLLEGKPGDGLRAGMSNPDPKGGVTASYEAPDGALCVLDPPHDWDPAHAQFNAGAMDGFVAAQDKRHPGDRSPMQYLTRKHLPVTWALADSYATCDRWFASVMGPTFPNRYYWLTGQSFGIQGNSIPTAKISSILGRVRDAGHEFRVYYTDVPFVGLLQDNLDVELTNRVGPIDRFFTDAAAGKLPAVTYVDPAFTNADDHPPHHPILGQAFIASVYKALAASPQWDRCLLVITYDEHGGFFDHVAPPKAADDRAAQGFDQLGMRVPALVVGPYVKAGHVSSVVRDHTSALKHVEHTFGTAPLTARSSAAADLSELVDQDRLARGQAHAAAEIPSVTVADWVIDASCQGASFKHGQHDILTMYDGDAALRARWDRRSELRDVTVDIARRARR